jgi:hypothetical protein
MPQVAPLEVHRNFLFQPNGSSEETGRTEDEAKIELQGPNEEYYSSDEAGDKDNATWIELQEDNIVGLCSQEIVEHMQEARICGKRDAAHHTLRNSRHASGSDTETMRRKHHAEKAAPAQFCLLRRYSWHASVHETEAMRSTCNAAEDAQAQRALLNRFSWPCEEPTLRRSMSSAEDETTKVMNLVHRPYQVIQYCSEASQAKVKMPRIKIPSIPPESELSRTSKVEPEMPQHRCDESSECMREISEPH